MCCIRRPSRRCRARSTIRSAAMSANVHGTVTLLDAARKAGVKRVVFAASSSAYGEKTPGRAEGRDDVARRRCRPTRWPSSPASTTCGLLSLVRPARRWRCATSTSSGRGRIPKSQYAAVIPNFVTAALHGRPATIFGDGEQSRDFCFIENAVEANLLACTAEGAAGEVFNIACGESTSLLRPSTSSGASSARRSRRTTSRPAPATSSTRSPTSARRAASSATPAA